MTTCQKNKDDIEGTRDAAIIGIMYAAGLRRNEVVSLSVGCYDPETGKLFFTSKCNKQRTVYITNGAAQASTIGFQFVAMNRARYLWK